MLLRSLLVSASFISAVSAVACGGTPEGQPFPADAKRADASPTTEDDGFPAETKGWPETVATTAAWPFFGSANTGVVIAPRWIAPQQIGCGEQVRVRTEPSRNFAPGDGPRTVYGPVLGSACVSPGLTLLLIDEARYDEANLFRGDCASGVELSTQSAPLATIHFASAAACETFMSARTASATSDGRRRTVTELRLMSLQPNAVFEFGSVADAPDDAALAVTVKK
jgi:hypothetical protein